MRQDGFSLTELLIVMAIMITVMSIGLLKFNQYTIQTGIEQEVKSLYLDISKARTDALVLKAPRSFGVYATDYRIFSSADGSGATLVHGDLKYPVTTDYSYIVGFDNRGIASGTMTICVGEANNAAAVDSVVVSELAVQLGKRKPGGGCTRDQINLQ